MYVLGYVISKGYQRNSMWNFQGLIKSEMEFPEGDQEKISGNSSGLFSSWPWNFQGIQHNSVEYLGAELCFIRNFQG